MVAPKNLIFLDTNIFVIDLEMISRKLSFGDAIQLYHVESHFPIASAFVTWDAGHFKGKSAIPVLTPAEYLR